MTDKGKRVTASLRSPDEDAKKFSSLVVLATIFFNQPITLEGVKKRLEKVFEELREINESIYFYFGSDHDPHRLRNLDLEDLFKNLFNTGYLTLFPHKKKTWCLLREKAVEYLMMNFEFLTKYFLLNKKRIIKCLDGVSPCIPKGRECAGCGG